MHSQLDLIIGKCGCQPFYNTVKTVNEIFNDINAFCNIIESKSVFYKKKSNETTYLNPYLDAYLRFSWCTACTILKSTLASSSKIGFMSGPFSYTSMNHLASNLRILQCSGSSKA